MFYDPLIDNYLHENFVSENMQLKTRMDEKPLISKYEIGTVKKDKDKIRHRQKRSTSCSTRKTYLICPNR